MKHNPIIVALDVASAREALALAGKLGDRINFYKVGMELYAAAGMEMVRELQQRGASVFLDLKLFDIGETVKRAVAVIAQSGARFLTVHSSAAVMRAAIEGRGGAPLQILAVTVLTSFGQQDVADLGYKGTVEQLVEWRVRKSMASGVDGLIASPLDVKAVRIIGGPGPILVTPGVRSAGAARGDQQRVATPEAALNDGANYVVMGRQITRAADPAAEVERVLHDITAFPSPTAG